MSTTTATPVLDVSGTPGIPFGRLLKVELRKLFDTRASRWLLIAIVAITVVAVAIFYLNADSSERTFGNFIGFMAIPQAFLLPVLGILLITSEWSQRTALVTFTMVPHRARVIAAKVVASVVAGLVAVALAIALAALASLVGGASDPFKGVSSADLGQFALLETLGVLQGLAFGLIFLISAAAIVTYYVLPIAFSILFSVWGALRDAAPWVDLGTAQQPLQNGDHLTGENWAQLASAAAIWVLLPFVLGLVRVLRAEVK
jgi:ABC-2 type transport system permease protein